MGIPPPYEFPNNTKEYKFMDNNEIRNNLSSHTSNTTDTELEDLNQPTVAFPNTFPKYNGTILTNTEYMDQEEHRQQENDSKKAPFTQGRVAATLVCVFLGLSIMSYAGLLLWRKYLEWVLNTKYGHNQIILMEILFIETSTAIEKCWWMKTSSMRLI